TEVTDSTDARADALLVLIARCPNVPRARLERDHPCKRLVLSQPVVPDRFQVPEPWSGELRRAPVLFVSSNPGFGLEAAYPTASWSDTQLRDYFGMRFGGGTKT